MSNLEAVLCLTKPHARYNKACYARAQIFPSRGSRGRGAQVLGMKGCTPHQRHGVDSPGARFGLGGTGCAAAESFGCGTGSAFSKECNTAVKHA